jgi:N6-L-threonylcarbamoyladenine synthase
MLLAVESSCDESALALFDPTRGVVHSAIHTQIPTHALHGGVVPELAVREHLLKFPELLKSLPVGLDQISEIAVTVGPGLVGSLAIGISLARAMALELGLPLRGVNHLRGHAFSPFIELHAASPAAFKSEFEKLLPQLGMVISGGNTLLFEISLGDNGEPALGLLARTRDDAAGEAIDKGAKLLGLPYPGGPVMEKLAASAPAGEADKYTFPVAFIEAPAAKLDFSFSGLKTSLRYQLEKLSPAEVEAQKPAICAAYQAAVIENLALMTRRALKLGVPYRSIGISGGVSQNSALRAAFAKIADAHSIPLLTAPRQFCGDNAAMIAFASWLNPSGTLPVESFAPSLKITNEL